HGVASRNDAAAAHAERGLRSVRPPRATARDERTAAGRWLWSAVHEHVDGKRGRGYDGSVADRQSHGRHAPDPLPPGQRAGDLAAAFLELQERRTERHRRASAATSL